MNKAVTTSQPKPYTRLRALPAFLGLFLIGALSLGLSLPMLVPPIRAIINHAPFVSFWPRYAALVPAALTMFSFAATTMIPPSAVGLDNARGKRRRLSRGWMVVLNVCLGTAMACALLMVVAVPVTEIAVLVIMPRLHYMACPARVHYERHPPQRWVLSYDYCPL